MLKRWLVTFVVLALMIFGLFSYKGQLAQAGSSDGFGEPVSVIETYTVSTQPYQATTRVNGETVAVKTVMVKNELVGKVSRINFASGDIVKKGQVLIELAHEEISAQLIAAEANVKLKQQNYDRVSKLFEQERISESDADRTFAELKMAESEVAVLQTRLDKKILTAPFDAYTSIHNLEVGQYLEANTEITQLVGVEDYIWVDFYVPQTFGLISNDTEVSVKLAGSNESWVSAKVVSSSSMFSAQSRSLKYRAKLILADLFAKPQQLLSVQLPVAAATNVVMVPDLAVIRDSLGEYVYVIQTDEQGTQRAIRTRVKLGERVNDMVIIQSGINVGDQIAAKGSFKLMPNMKIIAANGSNEAAES